jgi:peptidyl-dipeptidase A
MSTLKNIIDKFEKSYIPLYSEAAKAYFAASISGSEKDYAKSAELEVKLMEILSDKKTFRELKSLVESGEIIAEPEKRILDELYRSYLSHQLSTGKIKEMIDLQTEIEKKYATFRVEFEGETLSDNEVEQKLEGLKDAEKVKRVWLESKKIGEVVAKDVIRLVKLRNEAARELGFENFHIMSLTLSEQSPEEIERVFDALDVLTKEAFLSAKVEMDLVLAKRFSVQTENLRPWHYQNRFFQEAPSIYPVDLDRYYKDKDLVEITQKYFANIGLPIADIIKKSDLFEKEGKNQHAYCMNVDRKSDIRVLCNIVPNLKWMDTMLHEYGHAVYDKFLDQKLSWILRAPAHTFTTEAIAIFFGSLASNAEWLKSNLDINAAEAKKIAEASHKQLRLEKLIFSRWAQVVYHFEKAMYADPDQNLNILWWDLVEKYQCLCRPDGREEKPDWASKIHLATVPAYYHNYLLGTVLSSQIKDALLREVPKLGADFSNNKKMGEWLTKKIFLPGGKYHWDEMIERAFGEKMTPKYFADEYVSESITLEENL